MNKSPARDLLYFTPDAFFKGWGIGSVKYFNLKKKSRPCGLPCLNQPLCLITHYNYFVMRSLKVCALPVESDTLTI